MLHIHSRIRWTSRQVSLVVDGFLAVIRKDLPDFRLKHAEDYVGVSFIRSNIHRAQMVLERDYHREHFAKEQLQKFNVDVTHRLWNLQLEEDKKNMLLSKMPMETLLTELARRQEDGMLEKLLDRLEGPLMQRLSAKLDSMAAAHFKLIEERVKHRPTLDTETKTQVPAYVVIGLLGEQQNELDGFFNSAQRQCDFTFLDAAAKGRVADVCRNRIVFLSRFVSHSNHETAKKVATKAVFVNGHLNEMKRLIQANINEFKQLQEKA